MDDGVNGEKLQRALRRQSERKQRFERAKKSFLGQTAFAGMLGLVFVLPVVAGAYLGRWLDTLQHGYSLSWTVNLILLGVVFGAFNVYLLVKER